MEDNVGKAYESLVPKDQLVIDAMIIALYQKDLEIRKLYKGVMEQLDLCEQLKCRVSALEAGD